MQRIILVLLTLIEFQFAHAGVMEVSASYGIRNSSIDENNFTKNESWTGSFAWYFLELSALELSYTKGNAVQSLQAASETAPTEYIADFEMYGADLVVTLGGKESFFQPFVRGGAAQLKKKFFRKLPNGQIDDFGKPVDEVVPSYGVGFKVNLTKTFSLKASYDRWRSGSNDDKEIWDDAIKGGVSWYF